MDSAGETRANHIIRQLANNSEAVEARISLVVELVNIERLHREDVSNEVARLAKRIERLKTLREDLEEITSNLSPDTMKKLKAVIEGDEYLKFPPITTQVSELKVEIVRLSTWLKNLTIATGVGLTVMTILQIWNLAS